MVSLNLRFSKGSYEVFSKREATKGFDSFKQKIFERDHHKCLFCGFRATKHMWVVNKDENYRNNKMSNMATACPLCKQCLFVEHVNAMAGGGILIYLPEMTQAQLNATCHIIFSSIASGGHYSQNAKDTYRQLKMRAKIIEKKLGEGLSNPSIYGQMLIDSSKKAHAVHKDLSDYLRLLPNLKKFAPLVNHWLNLSIDTLA